MSTEHIVADSGARESFTSGMVRDAREGKGRFELITPVALRRLALVYERGAAKYRPRNWEKGSPLSRFADSAQRHLNDYQMIALYKREGIPLDRLPGDVNPNEDHLAQAVWNLCCIMHHEDLHPELDDLSAPAPAAPATYDVSVTHCGEMKINVIEEIRVMTSCNLKDAKEQSEGLHPVIENVREGTALAIVERLASVGATAILREHV